MASNSHDLPTRNILLNYAVCVRQACKTFGTKNDRNVVLDSLNMTVPRGIIYGLLGASGCGKTTLLSCIVGRRYLDSGQIWVLGGQPGSPGSGVPGPRVAYMPQELSLYGEFTIRETFLFFGWICGLSTEEIDERLQFFSQLLQLPHETNLIKNLSGGQQRRMSLAATLVHDSELIILDEPTIGVDPEIRENIWNYIISMVNNSQKTVIITTHYIEEAKKANKIGMMRSGRFLSEESPQNMMLKHDCELLEDVFLKLAGIQNYTAHSVQDGTSNCSELENIEFAGQTNDDITELNMILKSLPSEKAENSSIFDNLQLFKTNHLKTLLWKNSLWMYRNLAMVLCTLIFPIGQMALFSICFGHSIDGLQVAVANYELSAKQIQSQICPTLSGCNQTYLSCRYLQFLSNRNIVIHYYSTEEEAREAVHHRKAWGVLMFPSNYSESLIERGEEISYAEDWTLESSEIFISMDMADYQVCNSLIRDITNAYWDFAEIFLDSCEIGPNTGRVPIHFKTPIYGKKDPDFREYSVPGTLLTTLFFPLLAFTSLIILVDRSEGILERCLVMGVTGKEFFLSHFILHLILMTVEVFLTLGVTFIVFGFTSEGAIETIALFSFLNGLSGMCCGYLISCLFDTYNTISYVTMGSLYPIILLSGMMWPIQGLIPVFRYFAYALPLAIPVESIRSIMQKGWSITNQSVYSGMLVSLTWCVIPAVLCLFVIKFKKISK